MLFQSSCGYVFNSIELSLWKKRSYVGVETYSFCIEQDGELYLIGGDEDLHRAKKKAIAFNKKSRVDVDLYYFAMVKEDECYQEKICTICNGGHHSKAKEIKSSNNERQLAEIPSDFFSWSKGRRRRYRKECIERGFIWPNDSTLSRLRASNLSSQERLDQYEKDNQIGKYAKKDDFTKECLNKYMSFLEKKSSDKDEN